MENPKIRPIEAFPVKSGDHQMFAVRDPAQISNSMAVLSPAALFILSLCDGENTKKDIQAAFTRQFGTLLLSTELEQLLNQLDEMHLLESEEFARFKQDLEDRFHRAETRPAFHAGKSYPSVEEEVRKQFEDQFKDGRVQSRHEMLRAIIAPHIDIRRGMRSFAAAYRALSENPADLFIVLGISHQPSRNPFVLTRKNFETPLGICPTNQEFVNALAAKISFDPFEDEIVHRTEHSIEFQALFLKYVMGKRPFTVVPVLCGSFHEAVAAGKAPVQIPSVQSFLTALRETASGFRGAVCFIAGVDLAHVGGRFGDKETITPAVLDQIEKEDKEMLEAAARGAAGSFHEAVANDQDRRRICGYPGIYSLLYCLAPTRGYLLTYEQSLEPDTNSVVTFAGMSFSD
ncbi:MAG: AmmeMemoRadiSam system protein B [Armatimonadetes bacterium]|nr:AmmeMemoRadiSam system protein B [Armatimonadota bacterium]